MSTKCKCPGCTTQRYYDRVRSDQSDKSYELMVTSQGQLGDTRFYKKLDFYEYYNIISEYFNVEIDLPECENECDGSCCG